MLKNIKNNIVIPSSLKMNTDMEPLGGVLAWSGYVFVTNFEREHKEKQLPKFNLVSKMA